MPSAKDEIQRRPSVRPDPRVDPDGAPPPAARRSPKGGLRDVVAPRARKHDPRADPDSIPGARLAAAQEPDPEVEVDHDAAEEAALPAEEARQEPADPRLAEIEALLDRNAWKEIADKLGPPESASALPPALALIYALARREAAGDGAAPGATELAIGAMAAMLGVAPESAAALVLTKRILRQNPASWRSRPAPSGRLSFAIVLVAIVLGLVVGSFLSLNAFRSFRVF